MSETPEPEVILEPGDPGYVAPETKVEEPGPPGQDLRILPEKGETDAEFLARTRNTPVVSQSPTDIVPNTPQISLGNPSPPPAEEVKE